MKKQLLKLFNEAGFHQPEMERLGIEYKFEKFAELIAAECMSMCDKRRAVYFGHRVASDDFIDKNMYAEGETACDAIRYNIKQHFGIAE